MTFIGLILAIIALIAIYLVSKYKMFLLAALIANFPLLSLFTYSASQAPKHTALYLAVFSFIVSLSFLAVYLFGSNNKTVNIFIAVAVWLFLSITAFTALKTLGVR
jgi:hypothetical protein